MALVPSRIGLGEAYGSVAEWEAADYGGAIAGDDAWGQVVFSNGNIPTANTTLNNTVTGGSGSITLSAFPGEEPDGDPTTNALLHTASGFVLSLGLPSGAGRKVFSDLHIDLNAGNGRGGIITLASGGSALDNRITRNLIRNAASGQTSGLMGGIRIANPGYNITSNIVCNLSCSGTNTFGIVLTSTGVQTRIYNNTVANIDVSDSVDTATGISYPDDPDVYLRNNLVTDVTASGGGTAQDYDRSSVTFTTIGGNMSQDDTSPDVGLRGATNFFVSAPTDDYHLAAGSAAIGAADFLGDDAASFGASTDIDRQARAAPWDCGAHEFVGVAPPSGWGGGDYYRTLLQGGMT